ncbi:MAG TPA: hypothetical protein EYQ50_06825 [Verrucomicrobiales bacterium]|nr:hypothetical protein [Verrucomicrobiales bacterium]HIL71269.1 hypothetical protein [Verrucomicrobiota bacterium]
MVTSIVTMVGVGLFGTLLMLAFSQPPELRRGRRTKIAMSLPFLVYSAHMIGIAIQDEIGAISTLFQYVSCCIILAGIWAPNIAWLVGQGAVEFLFAPNRDGGGIRPDFKLARSLIEDDRLDDALKALKWELKKDIYNYEDRWLMAAIYKETKEPDKGLEQIKLLQMNEDLMPQQKENAHVAKKELLQLKAELSRKSS